MGQFNDTFTEIDVINCLTQAGLEFKNGGEYILSQCPTHDDKHPSTQIFKDDWFAQCHAQCGRYHITKAFPELTGSYEYATKYENGPTKIQKSHYNTVSEYKTFNLYDKWEKMPKIPRDHVFKGLPLEVLDDLGWRWDKDSYFIPYWSADKKTIPFAQWRHLYGERRFTFLKDAKPCSYGKWNLLGNKKLFVVEGTSDCAVMEYCGIPWIGMPSAASGTILQALAQYCKKNEIALVYAGDKDTAGDKLKEILDEAMPYRICQPPGKAKDWGEAFELGGSAYVLQHCIATIFE